MRIEVVIFGNIAKSNFVQLRRVPSSSCVHRKQDWPSNTATSYADENNGTKKSEIEISIKRLVMEDKFVVHYS